MISTRSQRKDEKKQKKKPTKNTTCVDLFDYSEIECCCDVCKKSIDQVNHTRKSKKPSTNDKHSRCKCQKPWLSSYATHLNRAVFHKKHVLI